MQGSTFFSVLFSLLVFTTSALAGEWHGQLQAANNYSYRGIQIDKDGYIPSGLLEYQHASGIYAGVWAVKLNVDAAPRGDTEINYFLGYTHELNPDIAIDSTYLRYRYPDATNVEYDWDEILLSLHFQQLLSVTVGVSDNWFGSQQTSKLYEMTLRHGLPLSIIGDFTYGYAATEKTIGTNYGYYEAGLNKTIGSLRLRAALMGADENARDRFGEDRTRRRIQISVGWGF